MWGLPHVWTISLTCDGELLEKKINIIKNFMLTNQLGTSQQWTTSVDVEWSLQELMDTSEGTKFVAHAKKKKL